MIPGFNVIVENLDYLLWGRAAAGEPGGVLLSLLMAAGALTVAIATKKIRKGHDVR